MDEMGLGYKKRGKGEQENEISGMGATIHILPLTRSFSKTRFLSNFAPPRTCWIRRRRRMAKNGPALRVAPWPGLLWSSSGW